MIGMQQGSELEGHMMEMVAEDGFDKAAVRELVESLNREKQGLEIIIPEEANTQFCICRKTYDYGKFFNYN